MTTLTELLARPVLPEHAEGIARQLSANKRHVDTGQEMQADIERLQQVVAELITAMATSEGATLAELGKALPFIDPLELIPEDWAR